MRETIARQLMLTEIEISHIELDFNSRDEIPCLLRGLQQLYCDPDTRMTIFDILTEHYGGGVSHDVGRPGMTLWQIFVLGTLRTVCNIDYDHLKELADNHRNLRRMLAIPDDDFTRFGHSTLGENLSRLTPEILQKINVAVVGAGHRFLRDLGEPVTRDCRVDSFVVETDVDYPTDTGLLGDSLRKLITTLGRAKLPGWRQWQYHLDAVKKAVRKAQKARSSRSKDPKLKEKGEQRVKAAYSECLALAGKMLGKLELNLPLPVTIAEAVEYYRKHAVAQINQIDRRVFKGEVIPHSEKVFSIFEPHTRWVQKGKAGVPFELGVPVCIIEDENRFVLNYRIMYGTETDIEAAEPLLKDTTGLYGQLNSCSFDRNFYSPANLDDLAQYADTLILPRKGRPSQASQARENTAAFKAGRQRHSQVESGIAALENHGLDRVRDQGQDGFDRYVALAVVGRNVLRFGQLLVAEDRAQAKAEEKKRRRRAA